MEYDCKRGFLKIISWLPSKDQMEGGFVKGKGPVIEKSSRLNIVITTTKVPMQKAGDDDVSGGCDHNSPNRYLSHDSKCYFQDNWRYEKGGRRRMKHMSMNCIDCG